jgi:hypothetical protein
MKKMSFLYFACFICLFNSCKKTKCNDPSALNFSPQNQKDFGACTYFSDQFLGQYMAYDSSIENSFFGLTSDTINYHFNVNRYQRDTVEFTAFFKCSDLLLINADTGTVQVLNNNFCDRQLQGYFYFSSDTLRYNCWYSNTTSTIHRWGVAIKQQ